MAKANERFRLVWSSSRSDWMIAPETAKGIGAPATVSNAPVSAVVEGCLISGCHSLTSHTQKLVAQFAAHNKKSMLQSLASLRLSTAIALMFAGVAPSIVAQSLQDPTVRSGTATIDLSNTNHAVITQHSNKAIIDWRQFSIPSGSTVQFVQPSASSMVLNRVTGTQASQIDGNLLANGQVWLLNPSGVMIGNGGSINTASFLASTLDINNNDFLKGLYRFDATSNTTGRIVNAGTIKAAENGYVVLSGAQINNEGVIEAKLGSVLLGSGQAMTLDLVGDKLLSFSINAPVATLPTDGKASIENSGRITAQGGKVMMTARTATDVMHSVINVSGVVEATSARLVNGEIVLDGGSTGSVTVSGSLVANGLQAGETGGAIKVFGKDINVANNALLDARGDAGGGVIHVGGGWQGSDLAGRTAALTTKVASNAQLDTSAISKGNGGEIAVWSDIHNKQSITNVSGTLIAKGGATSGNGGRIETSGYLLGTNGVRVNASATKGLSGEWLLDPFDITILSGGARGNMSSNFTASNLSTIDSAVIQETLNSTSVFISTGIGSSINDGGDINFVSGSIIGSPTTSLTLHANRNVNFSSVNTNIAVGNLSINSEYGTTSINSNLNVSGNIAINSGQNINITGVNLSANNINLFAHNNNSDVLITTNITASGNFNILADRNIVLNNSNSVARNININSANGNFLTYSNITATGGDINLNAFYSVSTANYDSSINASGNFSANAGLYVSLAGGNVSANNINILSGNFTAGSGGTTNIFSNLTATNNIHIDSVAPINTDVTHLNLISAGNDINVFSQTGAINFYNTNASARAINLTGSQIGINSNPTYNPNINWVANSLNINANIGAFSLGQNFNVSEISIFTNTPGGNFLNNTHFTTNNISISSTGPIDSNYLFINATNNATILGGNLTFYNSNITAANLDIAALTNSSIFISNSNLNALNNMSIYAHDLNLTARSSLGSNNLNIYSISGLNLNASILATNLNILVENGDIPLSADINVSGNVGIHSQNGSIYIPTNLTVSNDINLKAKNSIVLSNGNVSGNNLNFFTDTGDILISSNLASTQNTNIHAGNNVNITQTVNSNQNIFISSEINNISIFTNMIANETIKLNSNNNIIISSSNIDANSLKLVADNGYIDILSGSNLHTFADNLNANFSGNPFAKPNSTSGNISGVSLFAIAYDHINVDSSIITNNGTKLVAVSKGTISTSQDSHVNSSEIFLYSNNSSFAINNSEAVGLIDPRLVNSISKKVKVFSSSPPSSITAEDFELTIEGFVSSNENVRTDAQKGNKDSQAALTQLANLSMMGGASAFQPLVLPANPKSIPKDDSSVDSSNISRTSSSTNSVDQSGRKPPPKDNTSPDISDADAGTPPKQAPIDPSPAAPVPRAAPLQAANNAPTPAPQSAPANNTAPASVGPPASTQVALAAPPPPVAPPPPSPVATEKPPTPKDAADSGDKTLAMAAPPPPPKPAAQSQASSARTSVVSPGLVDVQVPIPPRPPSGAAAEQPVPTMGNSSRW